MGLFMSGEHGPALDLDLHVRQSQHWTTCRRKVREVARVVPARSVPALVREARGRPPGLCVWCYLRWRRDRQRGR